MSTAALETPLHLPITLGTELLIEIVDLNLRVKCGLTGMRPGQYLLIGLSQHDLAGSIKGETLRESQIIVRYLFRGSVYGFKTRVLNAITMPERLLFLSYPSKIEEYKVRNNPRYECILPAVSLFGGDGIDTVIVDVSTEGCRCVIKTMEMDDRDAVYSAIDTNKEMNMLVQLPGIEERITLSGTVRNVNKDNDRIIFGLMFGSLERGAKLKLEDFISLISDIKKKEQ